jgi:hypothetical protein
MRRALLVLTLTEEMRIIKLVATIALDSMTRTILHLGLVAVIAIAPTLCCCKAALPRPIRTAASTAVHSEPTSAPEPIESCCLKARTSCCHQQSGPTQLPVSSTPQQQQPQPPEACACCSERSDAASIESRTVLSPPVASGEYLPLPSDAFAAGAPEHLGQYRGMPPPGYSGVDVRYSVLFERHVLRC